MKKQLREGELNTNLRLLLEAVERKDNDKIRERFDSVLRHVYLLMGETPPPAIEMSSSDSRRDRDFSLITEKMLI